MGKIKRSLPENSLIHHPCNSIFICFMHRLEERIDHFNLRWLGTDRSSIARNLWPVSGTNNLIKFQNVKSMFQMKYYLGLFCKWKHGTVFSQHRLVIFFFFFLNMEEYHLTWTRTYNVYIKEKSLTAATDGISGRPGEPCDTSIPRIRVGISEIKGKELERSIVSSEFSPPSWKVAWKWEQDQRMNKQRKIRQFPQSYLDSLPWH